MKDVEATAMSWFQMLRFIRSDLPPSSAPKGRKKSIQRSESARFCGGGQNGFQSVSKKDSKGLDIREAWGWTRKKK